LIDEVGRVAEGKALDLTQAAAVEGFATEITGATEFSAASDADVIVLADRIGAGEWNGDDGLLVLKRLTRLVPGAVVICAGVSQRELIERGVGELHVARDRLFGSAPEALASAARAAVALAVNGSPKDVALSVLGVPPAHVVIPWDDVSVSGLALTTLVDGPGRRRLANRVTALWPPGPNALAAATWKAIEAMDGRARSFLSCFVAGDNAAGLRFRTAAWPVRLGVSGIESVAAPSLSAVERVALDNAMML
jgi:malate dehydrogenase